MNEYNDQYDSSYYLFNACKSGNEVAIKFLLKHGADINKENNNGTTVLHRASFYGNKRIVKYLVEHGADIFKENYIGWTPLLYACFNGHKDIVKYLFYKIKDNIETVDNNNNKSNIENYIVHKMYNKHNLIPKRFQIIIEICAPFLNTSSSLIKLLMKNNKKEFLEILFINHLKFFDNEFILKLLMCYKWKTSVSNSELYPRINDNKYKLPIKLNINIDQYNSSFYLFNACKSGNKSAVNFLLEHGADINIETKDGQTPIFNACESGYLAIVKYLVEHGADINKVNVAGWTPLFYACKEGHEEVVKYLAENKANINKNDHYGWTPLFIACQRGHNSVVKCLVEHRADINKKNDIGRSPLYYACQNGHEAIVKYLVKHKYNINK